MSFLLSQNLLNQEVDEEKIKLAEIQFEGMKTTFNTMMKICRTKCIPEEYGEADLTKGEMVCIDRCVGKYYKANVQIGQLAQSLGMDPMKLPSYQQWFKLQREMERNSKK